MQSNEPIIESVLTHGFRQKRIQCGRARKRSNRWMVEVRLAASHAFAVARCNFDRMNLAAASRSQLAVEHAR